MRPLRIAGPPLSPSCSERVGESSAIASDVTVPPCAGMTKSRDATVAPGVGRHIFFTRLDGAIVDHRCMTLVRNALVAGALVAPIVVSAAGVGWTQGSALDVAAKMTGSWRLNRELSPGFRDAGPDGGRRG